MLLSCVQTKHTERLNAADQGAAGGLYAKDIISSVSHVQIPKST